MCPFILFVIKSFLRARYAPLSPASGAIVWAAPVIYTHLTSASFTVTYLFDLMTTNDSEA